MTRTTNHPTRAQRKARSIVLKLLEEHFGDFLTGLRREPSTRWKDEVHLGSYNGWGEGQLVTIVTEGHIPSWAGYNAWADNQWWAISDKLAEHGLFAEPYNAAIVNVYEI